MDFYDDLDDLCQKVLDQALPAFKQREQVAGNSQ